MKLHQGFALFALRLLYNAGELRLNLRGNICFDYREAAVQRVQRQIGSLIHLINLVHLGKTENDCR